MQWIFYCTVDLEYFFLFAENCFFADNFWPSNRYRFWANFFSRLLIIISIISINVCYLANEGQKKQFECANNENVCNCGTELVSFLLVSLLLFFFLKYHPFILFYVRSLTSSTSLYIFLTNVCKGVKNVANSLNFYHIRVSTILNYAKNIHIWHLWPFFFQFLTVQLNGAKKITHKETLAKGTKIN